MVTSNQVSQSCILGTICLDIWVVLDNGKKTMAKCPNTLFYVANSEIILQYPILGTNFLQQHKVILNYQTTDDFAITAQTMNSENQLSIGPLLVSDNNSEIEYRNVTEINNVNLTDYIFQSKFINYGQVQGVFKSNPTFQVPTQRCEIIGNPLVHFEKIYGRIWPRLQVEDCVKMSLHSKEVVDPHDLVLTFRPDDIEVGHQQIRGDQPSDGQLRASKHFLDPEIKINLAQVGAENAQAQSEGLECKNLEGSTFSDSTNTSMTSSTARESPGISLTGYLQKLQEVAQCCPQGPKVDLEEDITILALKVKERLDESTIVDVE